ncbi:hypothetical protein A2V61_01010 [Candidatus Woesebacteria bacterium RBG_19FT_COMBO_47_8]|nr:MAG: hypothetical protein A2V61_01010 [Candidatus Woesebacteria bacterium RBG_19FT_COMBO_47_8]
MLSLAVATMSIAIRIFQKQIVPRYGGHVAGGPWPDMAKENKAKKWINNLLWTTAILSLIIAAINIGVAILKIAGKSW